MSSLTKKILQDLFKSSEGLFIFTLYQRFNISPKELFLIIKDLTEKGIILEQDDRILLTSEGKEFVIKTNLSVKNDGDKYEKIPEQFLGRRIEINEFYLPTSIDIQNELLT